MTLSVSDPIILIGLFGIFSQSLESLLLPPIVDKKGIDTEIGLYLRRRETENIKGTPLPFILKYL